MALTSALFTGLSGLDVNQTRLNVVGNNIANVNTVAFKSSRALFKPQFYVTDAAGSPPSGDFGGTNPSQRGLGAAVGSIEKNFSAGQIEPTGKATDFAIDGEGFFVVKSGSSQAFTRDGSFDLNSAHQLVTSSGEMVQGFGVDSNFNVIPGVLTNVVVPLGSSTTAEATQSVTLEGNLNASGDVAAGVSILNSQALTDVSTGSPALPTTASLLTDVVDAADTATPLFSTGQVLNLAGKKGGRTLPDASFTVTGSSTLQDLSDFFKNSLGLNDTLSPAPTPPPGATLETLATDAGTTARFTVTGNGGKDNEITLSSTSFSTSGGASPLQFADGENAAGDVSDPSGESIRTSMVVYDSLGTPLTVNVTAVYEQSSDAGNVWRYYAESPDDTDKNLIVGTGTLTYDNTGKLLNTSNTDIQITRTNTGAKTPLTVSLDFSKMTGFTDTNSQLAVTKQDGSPIGTLQDFSVGADGTITGAYTNGLNRALGRLAVATFTNPEGLVDKGSNNYVAGPSSGVPIIDAPLSLGAGAVRSGSLELSNVDLSVEFTNLIIASTGFTAASRVISTSNQLITELLNTSR